MSGKKSPILSNPLFKFLIFFNVIVVVIFLSVIYDSLGGQLRHQQMLVGSFADSMQSRIDTYRFATWQIYQNQASADDDDTDNSSLQETRLRPDIYSPVGDHRKTEALIFGSHGTNTLANAQNASDFLDNFWGIKKNTWSMYYLNGQDNSLTMVSTLPLTEMMSRYNGESITSLVSTRRAEMLQQANTLDERESFSGLRHMSGSDNYYFTLRTTFNQPGHLATVLAFDLPVNDMLRGNLIPERLVFHNTDNSPGSSSDITATNKVNLATASVEVVFPLPSSPMVITYQVSILMLLSQSLHEFSLTLSLCLLLLLSSLVAGFLLRRFRQPEKRMPDPEIDLLRSLNKEMINSLPIGFVIYDFSLHREVVSNEIAAQLTPHLNLQKIVTLSENAQGMLQVTINNEVYEVRHQQSHFSPQYRFFIIRNQDREILVNKKLQNAQKILDKNHQMRRQLLENVGRTFRQPLSGLREQLSAISPSVSGQQWQPLADYSDHLLRLTDNIILLNQLENDHWTAEEQPFSLQQMMDEIVTELLPSLNQRGLELIVNNFRPADEIRIGDSAILRKILLTLMWYSFGTTRWGKISVRISASPEHTDRLMVNIVDTGQGLNKTELANADFPFSGDVSTLNEERSNSMDLFFCRKFCQALNGRLEIVSKPDMGTHFSLQLPVPAQPPVQEQDEKILDGVTVLVDVVVDDIYKIVSRQLEYWGAKCLIADERVSGQEYDFLLTDVPAKLTGWAVLINGSEPGYCALNRQQYRANYNLNQAFLEALLSLIEKQLTEDEMEDAPEGTSNSAFGESEYFQIFKDTVPDDVNKLLPELADKDYAALALTAHRLKGVFAMLGLDAGKTQCEQLEHFIEKCDDLNIKNAAQKIDDYVSGLLQQGN